MLRSPVHEVRERLTGDPRTGPTIGRLLRDLDDESCVRPSAIWAGTISSTWATPSGLAWPPPTVDGDLRLHHQGLEPPRPKGNRPTTRRCSASTSGANSHPRSAPTPTILGPVRRRLGRSRAVPRCGHRARGRTRADPDATSVRARSADRTHRSGRRSRPSAASSPTWPTPHQMSRSGRHGEPGCGVVDQPRRLDQPSRRVNPTDRNDWSPTTATSS